MVWRWLEREYWDNRGMWQKNIFILPKTHTCAHTFGWSNRLVDPEIPFDGRWSAPVPQKRIVRQTQFVRKCHLNQSRRQTWGWAAARGAGVQDLSCSACQTVRNGAVHSPKYNHNNPLSTFIFRHLTHNNTLLNLKLQFDNIYTRKHTKRGRKRQVGKNKKAFSADLSVYQNLEVYVLVQGGLRLSLGSFEISVKAITLRK